MRIRSDSERKLILELDPQQRPSLDPDVQQSGSDQKITKNIKTNIQTCVLYMHNLHNKIEDPDPSRSVSPDP